VRDALVGDVELDLRERDVAAHERIDGLVDRFLDREAERRPEGAVCLVEPGQLARGEDAAGDVLARGCGTLEIDPDARRPRRCDERDRTRALVADRADPALGEDRSAAIVGEDRMACECGGELGERRVQCGTPRDQLAATDRGERGGKCLLGDGQRGERRVECSIGELDDRAEAVRCLEPLVGIRAWQGARSAAG
jgi:hypothetical protein